MSQPTFVSRLHSRWNAGRHICLGLDPSIEKLPEALRGKGPDGVIEFNAAIIEATADLVAAYKPQSAYYERLGHDGPRVLLAAIQTIREHAPDTPIILDAKRADIGSTNDAYVETIFDFYGADATTVSPYLGPEAMQPFTDRTDRGVIVLCRTSNPGAGRYQNLEVEVEVEVEGEGEGEGEGEPLYMHVARDVETTWNTNGNCGLVVGATAPDELAAVRKVAPSLPILVPGIGAQGGDLGATVAAGTIEGEMPLLISSSRELIYAHAKQPGKHFAEASRVATLALHEAIVAARAAC